MEVSFADSARDPSGEADLLVGIVALLVLIASSVAGALLLPLAASARFAIALFAAAVGALLHRLIVFGADG